MMRPQLRILAVFFGLFLSTMARAQVYVPYKGPDGELKVIQRYQPCDTVRASGVIHYRGRNLRENEGIRSPQLRRASALISVGCASLAQDILREYQDKYPDDIQAHWLDIRIGTMDGHLDYAEETLRWLITEQPDFSEARLLLATVLIQQAGDYADHFREATSLLNQVERDSPDNLWLYMLRLWLEALQRPDTVDTSNLLAIINDPQFPGTSRDLAAYIYNDQQISAADSLKVSLKTLEFDSPEPLWSKAIELARELTQYRFSDAAPKGNIDYSTARDVLLRYAVHNLAGRRQLAITYLLEASTIAPYPTPDNQALVNEAFAWMDDDMSPIQQQIVGRKSMQRLRPFVDGNSDPNKLDQWGRTELCNAIMQSDLDAFWSALARNANTALPCNGESPIDQAVNNFWEEQGPARQVMVREMLERGERPTHHLCRSEADGTCYHWLDSILSQYDTQ